MKMVKDMKADEWSLYSSMAGSNLAAHTLSKKLSNLLERSKSMAGSDMEKAKAIRDNMRTTMNKLRKFGAMDTEPKWFWFEGDRYIEFEGYYNKIGA